MSSFKEKIQAKEIKRSDVMKILLEDIHEEAGFNERTEGEDLEASIAELAEFIVAGGKVPPIEVRNRDEGGAWLVDGHRRTRAYRLLDKQGRLPRDPEDGSFRVTAMPFDGNDAMRVLRIVTSNASKPLTTLEVSRVYNRLVAFDWTPEQIAKSVGKTKQHVEQMLTLANSNSDVQKLVAAGNVSASLATATVRQHGEGAGKFLNEKLVEAQAAGKTKVTPKIAAPKTEAQSERERLNFLIENRAYVTKTGDLWMVVYPLDNTSDDIFFKTPRLAIDAAIAAQKA